MKIGIDIDDTLADTYEVLFHYAQKYTSEQLKRSGAIKKLENEIDHKYVRNQHNWIVEEEQAFFDLYYKEILEQIRPKLFATETVNNLSKRHTIFIITARWETKDGFVERITKKWLAENEITYCKFIMDAVDKTKAAIENDIDIFIDDSYKNCRAVADLGIKTYLMDSRVNGSFEDEEIQRVYSWPHAYQEITKFEEENQNGDNKT